MVSPILPHFPFVLDLLFCSLYQFTGLYFRCFIIVLKSVPNLLLVLAPILTLFQVLICQNWSPHSHQPSQALYADLQRRLNSSQLFLGSLLLSCFLVLFHEPIDYCYWVLKVQARLHQVTQCQAVTLLTHFAPFKPPKTWNFMMFSIPMEMHWWYFCHC